MPRKLLATMGVILVALAGHAGFVALVFNGAPCLNTLYPGQAPHWLCDSTRFAFYATVASGAILVWRTVSRQATPLPYALLVATVVWVYWYVLDPALLIRDAGASRLGKWLMQHTYGTPLLGELYWGWGFAKWHWLLAAGQGVLTAAVLLLVSKAGVAETPEPAQQRGRRTR